MFAKIESSFGALKKYAVEMFGSAKARIVTITTMLVLLLMGVAEPAQAATVQPKTPSALNIMCYLNGPTLDWLAPAKPQTKMISGIVLGVLIICVVGGTIVAAFRVALAGKHSDKAADGVRHFGNAIMALCIGFGGLVVVVLLIGIWVSIANFQNC